MATISNQVDNHSRTIRARFTDNTVRVYQAFNAEIASAALAAGRLVAPFRLNRMTWLKPSFNWMMYRSGFGTKPGQEVVLALDIARHAFDWMLGHAVLSSFVPNIHGTPGRWRTLLASSSVRVQWDPERDWRLNPVPATRTLQLGLSGEAVVRYSQDWIVNINDVSGAARTAAQALALREMPVAPPCIQELPYPIDPSTAFNLNATR